MSHIDPSTPMTTVMAKVPKMELEKKASSAPRSGGSYLDSHPTRQSKARSCRDGLHEKRVLIHIGANQRDLWNPERTKGLRDSDWEAPAIGPLCFGL